MAAGAWTAVTPRLSAGRDCRRDSQRIVDLQLPKTPDPLSRVLLLLFLRPQPNLDVVVEE